MLSVTVGVLLLGALCLAEPHKRATGTNVAQGKDATQSSIWSVTNPASYIVDGDTSDTFRIGGHCGQTGYEVKPYFMVDLGDSYLIDSVEIWTREKTSSSYAERTRDFEVRVGNSAYHPNNAVCTKFDGLVGRKVEAKCGAPACGRYISVQRTSSNMNYMDLCELKAFSLDGKAGCVAEDEYTGVCSCTGDPHCQSFDGKWLHFQGACIYTLAQDGCEDGSPSDDPSWSVTANFDREGSTVSYVRQVTVTLEDYNLVVEMFQDKEVHVNGQKMLGSPKTFDDKVTISITPNQVYLQVEGGIRVRWDGTSMAKVELQESMKGKVCGICGNFNGDKDDDWTVGPSEQCMDGFDVEAGEVTDDTIAMGTSWTAAIDDGEAACAKECPTPPPGPPDCSEGADEKAQEHCAPLKDKNGPFKDCLAKMDDMQAQDLFDNCVYDSCHLQDYETVVCEHAASMNQICQAMFSITVEWRGDDLCEMECGDNMEYKACGEPCVPTCNDPKGENCGTLGECTEGCFCKDGYVFDGEGNCIKEEQCGCLVEDEGIYINVGESYVTEDCGKKCVCTKAQGELECEDMECPTNQVCALKDGEYGCYCEPPFTMVDDECVEYPYPCVFEDDDSEEETRDISCLTCKNAQNDEDCEKNGAMETCTGKDPICVYTVTKDKNQEVKKVERSCGTRDSCAPESIGESAQKCTADGLKSTCTNCGYGPEADPEDGNDVYQCAPPPTEPAPTPAEDPCVLNKDGGEGGESLTRWYFKLSKCKCMKFTYKGSGGNTNNFASKSACEAKCSVFETPADCLLEKDPGPCDKFKKWYYFDSKKQKCKKFNYGGCEGNANLFKKKDECRTKCKRC